MTTIDEMCSVMRDAQRGKPVQWRQRIEPIPWDRDNHPFPWGDDVSPTWNWGANEYRIKPEPREWWLLPHVNAVFNSIEDAQAFAAKYCLPNYIPVHVKQVIE